MGKNLREKNYHDNEFLNEIIGIATDGISNNEESKPIAMYIPLLKFSDIRDDLTLSEYLIYLLILSFNLKGEFFYETNSFISNLLGIRLSIIEKSINKLITKEYINYVNEKGESISLSYFGKRVTRKEFEKLKQKKEYESYISSLIINDKREFVVNYELLDFMIKSIPL